MTDKKFHYDLLFLDLCVLHEKGKVTHLYSLQLCLAEGWVAVRTVCTFRRLSEMPGKETFLSNREHVLY